MAAHPRLLHKGFEDQVRATPDRIALVHGDVEISYADLNRDANRIAHRLRRQGVARGDLVGVCLPRDRWLLPAILAVLKAGAGYVPLDPAYPHDRLALLAGDAGLRHIVAAGDGPLSWLPGVTPTPPQGPAGPQDDADLDVPGEPSDPAYVIYTSGSTGRPKGVVVEHRNSRNLIDWVLDSYDDAELAGALFAASVCFDFSIAEIFPALLSGGTVIQAENLLALHTLPARDRVRTVCGVPSVLSTLLGQPLPSGVRTVNIGGEQLSRALVDRVFAQPGVVRALNLYGPTECTTYTTAYELDSDGTGPVPLGSPVAGAVLSVRDAAGVEVPAGEIGELWVGGPLVARGYLRRPELTAQAFVESDRGREYRTGDLARIEDGIVHFHGRADQQVKVRGFRIEIGEVEAALDAHPLVRNSVVLTATGDDGGTQLVGFVECAGDPSGAELRGHVGRLLPEHMVPARIVVLDRLPLTSTGKADRVALAALPAPAEAVRAPVAPRDLIEQRIWEITAAALGRDGFGVLDRLGDLGGHSLTMARICAGLNSEYAIGLAPAEVFTGATVAELAVLVARRVDPAGGAPTPIVAAPAPVVRHPGAAVPVTSAQRDFWMIRQLGGARATAVAFRFRLTGSCALPAVQAALDAVVARHEVLRCAYRAGADGELVAVACPAGPVELVEAPETDLDRQALLLVDRPFDLDGLRPALRAVAGRTADGWELILATDHLVFDGWSVGALMRELAVRLAAGAEHIGAEHAGPAPVDPASVDPARIGAERTAEGLLQVGDLALREQALFAVRAPAAAAYWQATLAGATSPHDLPGAPSGDTGVGRLDTRLPAGLDRSVARMAAAQQVTPFAVYLAALAVVVHGLTGRRDTLLSTMHARRGDAGTDDLLGPLLGVLPVRVQVDPALPFAGLAKQVAEVTVAGLGQIDLPFEEMVAAVTRAPGAPALSVLFSLQPAVVPVGVRVDGIRLELLGELHGGGNPDVLACYVNDTVNGPVLAVEFPRARFSEADAQALTDRLLGVLGQALADPARPVGRLRLLDETELDLVRAWGVTPPVEPGLSLVEAVLAQASSTPQAIAVTAPDGSLSYAELDLFSGRVAAALLAAGLRPGEIVAVCLPRERLLPAVMLGVSRAGGTFLPLDPQHPVERLAYQVADCAVRLLLTDSAHGPLGEQLAARQDGLAVLDIAGLPVDPAPIVPVAADDICYVLYTSGSTGRPKGVEVSHGNLGVNLVAMRDVMQVTADDVVLSVSPISFDVGHLGIWLPLSVGACCVLVDQACVLDGRVLADRINEVGATVLFGPPTGLRLLLAADWPGKKDLRIMSIGEALDPALSRAVTGRVGQLWNGYGPTEAAIVTTMRLATGGEEHSVPIGTPLPGYRVSVLDEAGRPVPAGVTGELFIAGPAVSRRYRNRPEATAAAFDADPECPEQARYRTGDLVRWLPGGVLDFIGRRDHQVKVRGHRVELGEVESVLREHPLIADAVVTTAAPAGETLLVGYLVWRGEPDLAGVHAFLTASLPAYMVPQRWMHLPELPLNASGKVDRAALPAPAEAERVRTAPSTAMEEFVAGVWAEVLDRDEIYAGDDFFALGGQSFSATRVTGRLRDLLGTEVSVRLLFDHPVLAHFASAVEKLLLAESEVAA